MSSTRARLLADNIPIDAVTTRFFGNGSTLNFTINGSVGLINPNNLIVALDGAVQEPGIDYTVNNNTINFSTAPDNGAKVVVVYRNAPFTTTSIVPTTNTVTTSTIQLNAVTPEKLSLGAPYWLSNGNVALGHSSPSTNLHLNYANYAAILMGANNNTGFSITKETPANTFNIWTGAIGSGTNRLCMTSSGDIGIGGITSPQSKLDVHGTIGFGLRSGGQNQSGYLSNIWSNTDGYRFATLGSSYFNGTNWITNPNASFGSNNVSVINADTSGISFNLNAATANTQRTDSTATFNSFEKFRIDMNGIVNTFNNPINNCPTTVKAFLNFSETTFASTGGGAGPAIGPASTSIDQIVAGLDTGRWTWNGNWGPNAIGTIWYMNIGGNNTQYGGIDWTKGIQITSINGTFAFFKALGGPATVTPPNSINGDGTTNGGYTYQSFGIRNSFNVGSITRQATGRYRITFKTPMKNDWFVALVGAANSGASEGAWTVIDYYNGGGKNAFSTKSYIDISSYTYQGAAIDTAWTYFAILDQDYNLNY